MSLNVESHFIVKKNKSSVLENWLKLQKGKGLRPHALSDTQLAQQSSEFLNVLITSLEKSGGGDIGGTEWQEVRSFLEQLSRSRANLGFSPRETALFIFSLKQPLFDLVRQSENQTEQTANDLWRLNEILDQLGLYTIEIHQRAREEIILRQQQDMLELSTPVVQLWDGILALPMIGTLDSSRTQVVMETLLQRIVETGSEIAIIDITGVPTVDTLVAQHLLKTVTAARLMGAECIISGIRPQIAATIVHLGVDLGNIATKATLASAFRLALEKTNQSFRK